MPSHDTQQYCVLPRQRAAGPQAKVRAFTCPQFGSRLLAVADGIDPEVIHTAEAAAGSVPRVIHAHARARWTGRTLRVEIEGWVDPGMTARQADELGRKVADAVAGQLLQAGSLTWTTRAVP